MLFFEQQQQQFLKLGCCSVNDSEAVVVYQSNTEREREFHAATANDDARSPTEFCRPNKFDAERRRQAGRVQRSAVDGPVV